MMLYVIVTNHDEFVIPVTVWSYMLQLHNHIT